jgi:hypothetical protein
MLELGLIFYFKTKKIVCQKVGLDFKNYIGTINM